MIKPSRAHESRSTSPTVRISVPWFVRVAVTLFVITGLSACSNEQPSRLKDKQDHNNDGVVSGVLATPTESLQGQANNEITSLGQAAEAVGTDEESSSNLAPELRVSDVPVLAVEDDSNYCLNLKASQQPDLVSMVNGHCTDISKRLASVTFESCQSANLHATGCESHNGFPIYVSEFPPLDTRLPQGRILLVGGMHGDELTSVSIVFRWIEKLNKYHSGLFHWRVAPMMNPDGVLPKEAQRTNGKGVDLNRNMPSADWHDNALLYWRQKTGEDERKYPGAQPASEPESQWLLDEINQFKPDAIISVHAPYGIVDFDALLLNTAPKSLGKLRLNLLGTYPGSLGNYAGINRDIPVITLELPHAWVMPSHEESTRIWEDIVAWLKKNIDTRQSADTASEKTVAEAPSDSPESFY